MATKNRGKQFEERFKEDWIRTMPESSIDRIYDQVSGNKTISNISDFIGYKKPNIFYLECKSTRENTFNFHKLTQYEKLTGKVGIPGVRVGVVIWFIEHDRVIYVPIKTITQMKEDGLKSVNIRELDNTNYRFFNIPSKKLRVFMESDYRVLLDTQEED
jgi:Holliday junction resolvase